MRPYSTHGHLSLNFQADKAEAKTIMRVTKQAHPLRAIRSFTQPDGTAAVHLHNVSGGVLGGDHLALQATIGPEAQVQLTTPGSTRIYRHRPEFADATQTTSLLIGPRALLEYLPESIIPFAQSRYRQHTQIHLGPDAGLFWWEIVAPGRVAYKEQFTYDWLEMKTDIYALQKPIAVERLRFSPGQQTSLSMVRLGKFTYWATFYVCKAGHSDEFWQGVENLVMAQCQDLTNPGKQSWGCSRLVSDGLIIRGLGVDSQSLMQGLTLLWQQTKQALYQQKIYIPRKLY
ncbi:MAG: urease accessory protein UreD [Chloroflexota bacterium]